MISPGKGLGQDNRMDWMGSGQSRTRETPSCSSCYPVKSSIRSCGRLDQVQFRDQLADGVGGLVEGRLLFRGQLDLEDPLDPLPAELDGHANVQALHAVLPLEVD